MYYLTGVKRDLESSALGGRKFQGAVDNVGNVHY